MRGKQNIPPTVFLGTVNATVNTKSVFIITKLI